MKMSEKLQEIKKDNKGFSLVELIIVIAIMAILIGIVGMNVIPQIENANIATDAQVLSAVVSEATEAWTQVDHASHNMTITVKYAAGALTFDGGSDANAIAVAKKIKELEGTNGRKFKSSTIETWLKNPGTTITFSTSTGVVLNTTGCDKLAGYEFESR